MLHLFFIVNLGYLVLDFICVWFERFILSLSFVRAIDDPGRHMQAR